jgi:tellurite resistance protein TerC
MATLLFTRTSVMVGFMVLIIIGLAVDLGVFKKNQPHTISFKEALVRTIGWVTLGLFFSGFMYFYYAETSGLTNNFEMALYKNKYGSNFGIYPDFEKTRHVFSVEVLIQYITGYFVEYSLSIDNLFVMMLIFSSFQVPEKHRKNVLFWGVLGAVIMRFIFIFIGGALLNRFHWLMYLFGAILIYSGFKLLLEKDDKNKKMDTEGHPMVRLARKVLPISKGEYNGKFYVREGGKFMFTGLFVVLLVVEFSDLVFAVDSVPAIFGITRDPYIVFFSNIFAILGLRSLYFLLSHGMAKVHTLKYGLSIILVFIGIKMVFEHWFKLIGFSHVHNLMVLIGIIVLTVVSAYLLPPPRKGLE